MAIARELNARYLCLYGSDRVRFDTTGVLEPIEPNDLNNERSASAHARCYRLIDRR